MGIDLGTTNSSSAIGCFSPGAAKPVKVECVEIPQPTPSG